MIITLKDGSVKEYSDSKQSMKLLMISVKDWPELPVQVRWTDRSRT